jgi:hypothetical protein
MSWGNRSATFYEHLQRHISLTWYPLTISIFMFGVFSAFGLAAGQVQEALANYVSDRANPWNGFAYTRTAITLLALFIFATTLRYWTARLLGVDLRRVATPAVLNRWQRAFVGFAWFAPWVGAALSFFDAALSVQGAQASAERTFGGDAIYLASALIEDPLHSPFATLALITLVAPFLFLALRWSPMASFLQRKTGHWFVVRMAHGWALPLVFFGLALLFLLMPTQAIEFARKIGPVVLICFSFAVVTAAGCYLIHFGRMHGLPAFALVAILPLFVGALGLDDNHFLRQHGPEFESERPLVTQALQEFRREVGPGPIILVSAEGGGVRAAHFTSMVLARLADQCPRLARRIFFISAVSGGAVGAAAYRASLERTPLEGNHCDLDADAPPTARQLALADMFGRDHLSPTLAKLLFPELVQAFVPASFPRGERAFLPQTDRQLGLELSLEEAFADAFEIGDDPNPFAASVYAPEAARAPHLLINLTEVSSGGVFVASSIDLGSVRDRQSWIHDFRCLWSDPTSDGPCRRSPDFRLSTMAASSSRFPVVSPAGTVRAGDNTFRFVDGGYFDNSGVETLLGVLENLQRGSRANGQGLPPIAVLHIDSNPYQQRLPVKWRLDLDVHELQAVLATREERVRISLGRLSNLHQDNRLCSVRFVELTNNEVPLRLGWILSAAASRELQSQAAHQLAEAFTGAAPALCDDSSSAASHALRDRLAERRALETQETR